MLEAHTHPNRLGVLGWLAGGRWGLDRYLYSLHRLTGLGLLAYFLIHVIVTSSRALGPLAWQQSMERVSGPFFHFGEYLVFVAFAFHAINGLRLVFAELGYGVGKPIEPVYPYKTAVDVQRPWVLISLAAILVLVVLGTVDFYFLH